MTGIARNQAIRHISIDHRADRQADLLAARKVLVLPIITTVRISLKMIPVRLIKFGTPSSAPVPLQGLRNYSVAAKMMRSNVVSTKCAAEIAKMKDSQEQTASDDIPEAGTTRPTGELLRTLPLICRLPT